MGEAPSEPCIQVNEEYIAARLAVLDTMVVGSSEAVMAEMRQFAVFLASRRSRPAMRPKAATPDDVTSFLVHKELKGRTQYHVDCQFVGQARPGKRTEKSCDPLVCQIRAAPLAIKTAVSHLKSGLALEGLTPPWDPATGSGNPADSRLVRTHLKRLLGEAAGSLVVPLQAPPLFPAIFGQLRAAVMSRMRDTTRSDWQRLKWRQFWLFILFVGYSGRRPGDLAQFRTPAVVWLPNRSGLRCEIFKGKVATVSNTDPFVIKSKEFLTALRLYTRDCASLGAPLHQGAPFIFRKIEAGGFSRDHVEAANMNAGFQTIWREAGMFEGQSLYGFRVGAAIVADLNTRNIPAIMKAGGWASEAMAKRYSKFADVVANVLDPGAPESCLQLWFANRGEFAYFK